MESNSSVGKLNSFVLADLAGASIFAILRRGAISWLTTPAKPARMVTQVRSSKLLNSFAFAVATGTHETTFHYLFCSWLHICGIKGL